MNRFRSLPVVLTIVLVTLASAAQQNTASTSRTDAQAQHNATSPVDQHMQMLTERLGLSAGQQEKLRPLVRRMLDERQMILDDKSLSDEERHRRIETLHDRAVKEAKPFLTNEQKKKLDELSVEHGHKAHGQ